MQQTQQEEGRQKKKRRKEKKKKLAIAAAPPTLPGHAFAFPFWRRTHPPTSTRHRARTLPPDAHISFQSLGRTSLGPGSCPAPNPIGGARGEGAEGVGGDSFCLVVTAASPAGGLGHFPIMPQRQQPIPITLHYQASRYLPNLAPLPRVRRSRKMRPSPHLPFGFSLGFLPPLVAWQAWVALYRTRGSVLSVCSVLVVWCGWQAGRVVSSRLGTNHLQ